MTRRILAAFVGLTVVLLAGVVVPLGVFTGRHDRQVFAERTEATALGVANQAEERLADPKDGEGSATSGTLSIGISGKPGDLVSIYDTVGRLLPGASAAVPISAADRSLVLRRGVQRRWLDRPDRLVVMTPVTSAGRVIGVVALSRSAGELNSELAALWLGLAAAAVAALLAATLLGVALARWVGRPLRRLEAAATQLGEGTLAARAGVDDGPPELRQLAVTFNRMAGRLETLLAGQRTVIADVSHQLRTPLAALRLRLELIRQDVESGVGADLDGTLTEVNRLSHLLDGLLAVARAEHTTPTPRTVDVRAVAGGRVEAWLPVAAEAGLALEFTAPAAYALATPGHLEQMLDNLLANAIEATPPGGSVTVSVSPGDGRIRVAVSDTGPGMTAEHREQALRRFWSERHTATALPTDRQGSGLGLAIVDRLATVDGGLLLLEEAPGGGLAAIVDLPAADVRHLQAQA